MDTKLKNSHKLGILTLIILLTICSFAMMSQYRTIRYHLENDYTKEDIYRETIESMSSDLAEGNYLLYNEYSHETGLKDILDNYGQQRFDLLDRYVDYVISDKDGKILLTDLEEKEADNLSKKISGDYGVVIQYSYADGTIEDVQIKSSVISGENAYYAENSFIQEAVNEEDAGYISSISNPSSVTITYGMTEKNLQAYSKIDGQHEPGYYDVWKLNVFNDMMEILFLVIAAAALVMPFVKRLDLSEMALFRAPFEVVLFVLICYFPLSKDIMSHIVYDMLTGSSILGFIGSVSVMINFLMWIITFGILFWCVTSLRAIFRMKGNYWRERSWTVRVFRRLTGKSEEEKIRFKDRIKREIGKIKSFFKKQYDILLHLDFKDKSNKTILRIVIINFIILFIVCLFWWYGTFALILYSVLLFLFLRKFTSDLKDRYKVLLQSTNQLAEGHLDEPIEGDVGLFTPIQDELKRIQKGFKKAVDEEVKNERMKTELVTNVSHDLRTPLTAIITYVDLLKNESDEEKRKEYIEVLERKSLRLKVLIEDLFEISKAASKNVVMHYMNVDIVGLFKQVQLEHENKIQENNLEFKVKLPDNKIVMWLDSEKTYRIFENLIVNIIKYSMPHTRAYIEMTEEGKNVHIAMKNISAAELDFNVEEITDRFVRGDSSRNTEGSGLGLAIVKSFTELQHGTVQISTEADLFKVDLYLPKLSEEEVKDEEKK